MVRKVEGHLSNLTQKKKQKTKSLYLDYWCWVEFQPLLGKEGIMLFHHSSSSGVNLYVLIKLRNFWLKPPF